LSVSPLSTGFHSVSDIYTPSYAQTLRNQLAILLFIYLPVRLVSISLEAKCRSKTTATRVCSRFDWFILFVLIHLCHTFGGLFLQQMLELMEASGMDLSPQQQQQQQQQQQKDQAADESPVDRLAALLRPQGPTKAELDEAARIRQKEKFALRDFFSAQAAAESKKRV
jgi:hypothetical protein